MIERILPYVLFFTGALAMTLILTPIVREFNRRHGMVDLPDPRRINKVPIPRGGGLALVLGVLGSFSVAVLCGWCPPDVLVSVFHYWKLSALALSIALLGLADDRWSLPPRVKLGGQVFVAVVTWLWVDIGFKDLWPWIPGWLDGFLTVFWIVGAVNAFNLIDGLDGLAAGLAFIATLGMAGSLIFLGRSSSTYFYFAFAGGLLGFLRYNYNPASVFLGDCGSMFIGYVLSILPLVFRYSDSFLVSVGVPLLAMGVPIFDTSLAILRRTLRRLLNSGGHAPEGKVMAADSDHLHHRILRSVGLSQRRAAWMLYILSIFLVVVGLVGINLRSHRAGLWLVAVTVAAIVIFRDTARIELFDAGRLLNGMAHNRRTRARRKVARLAVPFYLTYDVTMLVAVFFFSAWVANRSLSRAEIMVALPIRVFSTFVCLVFFRVYRTIWSRAMLSNYMRLMLACVFGAIIGALGVYFAPGLQTVNQKAMMFLFALLSFVATLGGRVVRSFVRDLFYAIDCSRLVGRKDVSRILVYGAGLRYRAFRRELVRTASANTRIIVGLLDDDILLRNHYIGGIRVMGTLGEAPSIINEVNADAVVVACQVSDHWRRIIGQTLGPTGVKVTYFTFDESPASVPPPDAGLVV